MNTTLVTPRYSIIILFLFLFIQIQKGYTQLDIKTVFSSNNFYFSNNTSKEYIIKRIDANSVLTLLPEGFYLLYITNNGNTQKAIALDYKRRMSAIHVLDSVHFLVGTDNGRIFYTSNQGETWQQASGINDFYAIKNFAFYDAQYGMAYTSKGRIYRTQDAGKTWQQLPIIESTPNIKTIAYTTKNTAFAVLQFRAHSSGSNFLYKTVNAGATWEPIRLTARYAEYTATASPVFSMEDSLNGLLCVGPNVYTTNDGWKTFTHNIPYPNNDITTKGVYFDNSGKWYIQNFMSEDKGKSWQNSSGYTHMNDNPTTFFDATTNTAWTPTRLYQYTISKYGLNISNNKPFNYWNGLETLSSIAISENQYLITTDEGRLYVSNNSGRTFNYHPQKFNYSLSQSCFIDNKGFIIGYNNENPLKDSLFFSEDNGKTWEIKSLGVSNFIPMKIQTTEKHIFIYGDAKVYGPSNEYISGGYTLLISSDTGKTWINRPLPDSLIGYDQVKFLNENFGWISSFNGRLYITNNGGKTWIKRFDYNYAIPGIPYSERTYFFTDSLQGWTNGYPFERTFDGGKTWQKCSTHPFPTNNNQVYGLSMFAVDNLNCFISYTVYSTEIPHPQYLAYTNDGGKTWNTEYCYSNINLNNMIPNKNNSFLFVNGNELLELQLPYINNTKTKVNYEQITTYEPSINKNDFILLKPDSNGITVILLDNKPLKNIKIYTIDGRCIFEQIEIQTSCYINLCNIESGIFFLKGYINNIPQCIGFVR